jgi:hypothetical protein
MADINSSLPVRTEAAGDVDINISDAVTPSQKLVVEADGSLNVNAAFAAGTKVQLTDGVDDALVSAAGELQTKDDGAITLLGTIDADTSSIATDASTIAGDTTSIDGKTPALGAAATAASTPVNIASDQTVPVSAASLPLPAGAATSANQLPDGHNVTVDNAAGGAAVNIQDGGNSITVDGAVTVSATALDIRPLVDTTDSIAIGDGTDTLAINTDGSINVRVGDRSGTEQLDYDTATVASAATSNHDYTTTGTFRLSQIHVTASSSQKAEIQVETGAATGVFNTVAVLFTSEADLNADWTPVAPPQVISGARVRIIRENTDNQSQDLYSTITGFNE